MVAVSIDGELVAPERAAISVFDRGLLYGDGCFEVLRTWDGVARDIAAHLDRLYATAAALQLRALDRAALTEAVYRTIAAAAVDLDPAASSPGATEHRIRVVLTRGPGGLAQPLDQLGPGRAIVIVEPLPPQPTELTLAVVDWPLPPRRGPGHKTLAYLDSVLARELARAAGADEAVRLDPAGRVIEGASCNLFVVHGGVVTAPGVDRGALPGIVRARVLEACARAAIATRVRDVSVRELRGADEVFVTSSLKGVVPVTRIDGVAHARGPVAERLARAYAAAMRSAP